MLYLSGYSFPLIAIGLFLGPGTVRSRLTDDWWAAAFIIYAGIVVLFLNFQGRADLLLPTVAAGLGLGLVVARIIPKRTYLITALVLVVIVVNPLFFGGAEVILSPTTPSDQDDAFQSGLGAPIEFGSHVLGYEHGASGERPEIDSPYYPPRMSELYWSQTKPTSCHYRFAGHELTWLMETGRSPTATHCGQWP